MDSTRGQPVLANANSHKWMGRGRGRGRSKKITESKNDVASTISTKTEPSLASRSVEIKHGQFDDLPEQNRSIVKNAHKVKHSPINSDTPFKEKSTTSDKENSGSPKTQRSRRSVFDSGIMSQIHSHLRQGVNDPNMTRSLDRLNKVMPPSSPSSKNVRLSRLVSPDLKIQIPGNDAGSSLSEKHFAVAQQERLALEYGRPRSNTEPMSPPSAEHRKILQGSESEIPTPSDLLRTRRESNGAQSSVPSPLSTPAKPRGRGRGRGKSTRNKASEMETTVRPGASSGTIDGPSHQDSAQSQSRDTTTPSQQFANVAVNPSHRLNKDSHASGTWEQSSRSVFGRSTPGGVVSVESNNGSAITEMSKRSEGRSVPAAASLNPAVSSGQAHVSEMERSEMSKPGRGGLTLDLTKGRESTDGLSEQNPPAPYSPDDFTLLLSPNLAAAMVDWAAAMATPPPDVANDEPNWNLKM